MSKIDKQRDIKNDNSLVAGASDKVKLKTQRRCKECNKLLGVNNFLIPSFDIKCSRCGVFNEVLQDLDRQILITDNEGRILYINKQIEKATGYSAKEILGHKPSIWGGQMKLEFYKKLWNQIAIEKKAVAVELINRHKDGKLYPVVVRISPLLDEKGEVEFFIGIETVIGDGENILRIKELEH